MGQLNWDISTTLEGFITNKDGDMDWIIMGEECGYPHDGSRNLSRIPLLARRSRQPRRFRSRENQAVRRHGKVAFSRSLEKADWDGTRIFRDIVPEEVEGIKSESRTSIRLDGSANVAQQLTKLGLIDEYRFFVQPVVLGGGQPLFKERMDLELTGSEQLKNGVILLTYQLASDNKERLQHAS